MTDKIYSTSGLPIRKSVNLLPSIFQTESNDKFLAGTLDPLIQPGTLDKVVGYIGRRYGKMYNGNDIYLDSDASLRSRYQLEPGITITKNSEVSAFYDYIDFKNQLTFFNNTIDRDDKITEQDHYSWNPPIQWDKFVNYREYYWIPDGPPAVPIQGQSQLITSTYRVRLGNQSSFVFFPDGYKNNPTLTLYRGQTYKFNVNIPDNGFVLRTLYDTGSLLYNPDFAYVTGQYAIYDNKLWKAKRDIPFTEGSTITINSEDWEYIEVVSNTTSFDYTTGVTNSGIVNGTVTFKVPLDAPDVLYYQSVSDPNRFGKFIISDVNSNTKINVIDEIIGKVTYTSSNGITLSNGMIVYFSGQVYPSTYASQKWVVEGVGTSIKLVKWADLIPPNINVLSSEVLFDNTGFDTDPFSDATGYPVAKDYMVVNRSSQDLNPWSRYNRWFHKEVLELSHKINGTDFDAPDSSRAKRPIIEFASNLKLFNHGTIAKQTVDFIDTVTTDVFSTIEGSQGYYVDGEELFQGARVIFTADTDILANNRIFEVNFINHNTGSSFSLDWNIADSYRAGETARYQGQSFTANVDLRTFNFNVLSSFDATNRFRVAKNLNIVPDMAIRFNSPTFGNVVAGQIYYVLSVVNTEQNATEFTISTSKRGIVHNVTTGFQASNFMTATVAFDPTSSQFWSLSNIRRQISLKEVSDTNPIINECVLVNRGVKYNGLMFHYNGTNWVKSQEKTSVNQEPLFDVIDDDNVSFGDTERYPVTSFVGSKIISYARSNSVVDSELGFSLKYLNIDNIGDITFDFNWDTDTFTYEVDRNSIVKQISTGYYVYADTGDLGNCWIKADPTFYQGIIDAVTVEQETNTIILDTVKWFKLDTTSISKIMYFINGVKYTGNVTRINNQFTFDTVLTVGTVVSIKLFCNAIPHNGYYEIPLGLEKNPLNQDISSFTLGEATDHVLSAIDLYDEFSGIYPGLNNLRDISGYQPLAKRFLKHSGISPLAVVLLCDKEINVVKSLEYSAKAYRDYKNKFMQLAATLEYNQDPVQFVDDIIISMTKIKTEKNAFADSDMVGVGAYKLTRYEVEDPEIKIFALTEKFDLLQPSRRAVYVYHNNVQLISNIDYTFNSAFGFIQLQLDLVEGDIIDLREYSGTAYSFMPPSPTKLGLYKKYTPSKFLDDTYITPVEVIQGHDGSITVAYGDHRDEVLLELEKRIYNNIKISYNSNIFDIDTISGSKFFNSVFSKKEIDSVLSIEFRRWLQETGTTFAENTYFDVANPFTYVYNNTPDRNGNGNLSGWWRGIYKDYYDTDRPHTCPWEMLGFSEKPTWWEATYGTAPYTCDNLILWEDLRDGIIRDGPTAGQYDRYKRTSIMEHIPVDADGKLLDPLASNLVGSFSLVGSLNDLETFEFGDSSPIENAWRRSSDYPFALMMALSILRPFEFLIENLDKNQLKQNAIKQTVTVSTNKFITLADIAIPEVGGTISSGIINYIVNFLKSQGKPLSILEEKIYGIDVRLSSRLSGFVEKTQQQYILDSKNPRAKSSSVFVPQENFDIIFNVSVPFKTVTYSGMIIEKTERGYKVYGYDHLEPVFKYWQPFLTESQPISIGGTAEQYSDWKSLTSYSNGSLVKYQEGYYRAVKSHISNDMFDVSQWKKLPSRPVMNDVSVLKRTFFDKSEVKTLDYGSVFLDNQTLVDFIFGYEEYLKDQGFDLSEFDTTVNEVRNWTLSIKEFLFWTKSNWAPGSLISLSPLANKIVLNSNIGVIENLLDGFYGYNILQNDGNVLPSSQINVNRQFQQAIIETVNSTDSIYFFKAFLILKEHVTIFSDRTVFNDVIYEKTTGYRQDRIKSRGFRTTDWDGDYTSPGFIFDNVNIKDWQPFVDYRLGDIVSYKSYNWTSLTTQLGSDTFNFSNWSKLDSTPTKQLVSNFDFKVNQFEDYYNVDADGTSSSQRDLARHAVGYQIREYLQELSEDQVTQFNLYQGFIREKGTANAIVKVFDKLKKADSSNVQLQEEWAFSVGKIGGVDQVDYVEFKINKSDFKITPQPVIITNSTSTSLENLYIQVNQSNFTYSPIPYTSLINPIVKYTGLSRSAGYVRDDHVDYILKNKDDILNLDITTITENSHLWFTFDNYSWDVLRFNLTTSMYITGIVVTSYIITIFTNRPHGLEVDDYVGIRDIVNLSGFFKIVAVNQYAFTVTNNKFITGVTFDETTVSYNLCVFTSARYSEFSKIDRQLASLIKHGSKIWIDNVSETGNWQVIEKQSVFTGFEMSNYQITNPQGIGTAVVYAPSLKQTIFGVSVSGYVIIANDRDSSLSVKQIISPIDEYNTSLGNSFGSVIAISPDDMWLAVGAPLSSGVLNKFRGDYNPYEIYSIGDIVLYRGELWISLVPQTGDGSSIDSFSENWKLSEIVTASPTGYPGPSKQGAVFMYNYSGNRWVTSSVILSPRMASAELFGSSITISLFGGKYYMNVSAPGANNNTGRVYTFVYTNNNWTAVQNINYKGIFDSTTTYAVNSIVWYDNRLWKALSTIQPGGSINTTEWEITDNAGGFLPSRLSYSTLTSDANPDGSTLPMGLLDDSTFTTLTDPTALTELVKAGDKFGTSMTSNRDGSILIVGAPNADMQYFPTYRGLWNPMFTYKTGDVVRYVDPISLVSSYRKLYDPRIINPLYEEASVYISVGESPESAPWEVVGDSTYTPSGKVFVYLRLPSGAYELIQTISGSNLELLNDSGNNESITSGDQFGSAVDIDMSGLTFVVSSPTADINFKSQGAVYVFKRATLDSTEFRLIQKLQSFEDQPNEMFGTSVAINQRSESIVVGARNSKYSARVYFDNGTTTFDASRTGIIEYKGNPGQVYVYEKHDSTYFLTEKLEANLQDFEAFGESIDVSGSTIVVGSPYYRETLATSNIIPGESYIISNVGNTNWYAIGVSQFVTPAVGTQFTAIASGNGSGTVVSLVRTGKVRIFNKDTTASSWKTIAEETPLVNLDSIKSIAIYDDEKNINLGNIDIVDNYRLKILGEADEEITFKTLYDPAIYTNSSSTDEVELDPDRAWFASNVGKLWWNLNTVKFFNHEQGDITYKIGHWNAQVVGSSVDVYEWVESKLDPASWLSVADTVSGLSMGISGQPYSLTAYSVQANYSPVSGNETTTMYYFWVKNKKTVPANVTGRIKSAYAVASLIATPESSNVPFISVLSANEFLFWNIGNIIISEHAFVNIEYINESFNSTPIHKEYQLLTEGVADSLPSDKLESKWIDSLVGYDMLNNRVPDTALPEKQKYGISFRPRQSMFVDRFSVLSAVIDKINLVLSTRSFADTINYTNLKLVDSIPAIELNTYDLVVDTITDLETVGTVKVESAKFNVSIVNGEIDSISITNSGFGYKRTPSIRIVGDGEGASASITIDARGRVVSVTLLTTGKNYTYASISIRPFSVLVNNDESVNNFWAIYAWDNIRKIFSKSIIQSYDTTKYWNYVDWYNTGVSATSRIVAEIDNLYNEQFLQLDDGDIIRVSEYANGGWALLQKTTDGTGSINGLYNLVGRELGTIEINKSLLVPAGGIGLDSKSTFDGDLYDTQPTIELRNILKAVKNDIFIDEFKIEWNKLFFSSVRYSFVQLPVVDWAFKTSFINAIHNVGNVTQKINYKNDNLASYQTYIEEVKPYRTTIREYTSAYSNTEIGNLVATDFDAPAYYSAVDGKIIPANAGISDIYPWKSFYDNQGYSIMSINLISAGSGYVTPPSVLITGNGTGAVAKAYISNGAVSAIVVTSSGSGYTITPTISLVGGNNNSSDIARAAAVLGNGVIRSIAMTMKFDRISKLGILNKFEQTDTFTANGFESLFNLTFAPMTERSKISILKNGQTVLDDEYQLLTYVETTDITTVTKGRVIFNTAPSLNDNIVITYERNDMFLDSVNRIQKYYAPTSGMIGKETSQLMTGIDFGGVQIQGTTFDVTGGWDALPWFTDNWDSVESVSDFYYTADGSTTSVELPFTPSVGQKISIYLKKGAVTQRLDSETYPARGAMPTFIGNGFSNVVEFVSPGQDVSIQSESNSITLSVITDPVGYVAPDLSQTFDTPYITIEAGDILIFRPFDSDGSVVISDVNIIDTALSGGTFDLLGDAYTTATGKLAEEILIDGGKFINPDLVPATEENVPGNVLESLSIQVYHTKSAGAAPLHNQVYTGNGISTLYNIGISVLDQSAVLVYIDSVLVYNNAEYTIDFTNNQINFSVAPIVGSIISIIAIGIGGSGLLDYQEFVVSGATSSFLTNADYNITSSVIVTVNGVYVSALIENSSIYGSIFNKTSVLISTQLQVGDIVKIICVGSANSTATTTNNLIQINKQVSAFDGSSSSIAINGFSNIALSSTTSSVIVEINGVALRGPDTKIIKYDGTNNVIDIGIDPVVITGLLSLNDIQVYINQVQQPPITVYTFTSSTNQLTVNADYINIGDEIRVITSAFADFNIVDNNLVFSEALLPSLVEDDEIIITWFSNYPKFDIVEDQYAGGKTLYYLKRKPIDSNYIWVFLNGKRLTLGIDYDVELVRAVVQLNVNTLLTDLVKIIEFGNNAWTMPSAYEIYKDMFNSYHFTRLSDNTVKLSKDLTYYDQQIEVTNGDALFVPTAYNNIPGVIMINSERIEYLQKNGNILSQLRRGSFGSSIAELHSAGINITDISPSEKLPYMDKQHKYKFVSDGSSIIIGRLDFVPAMSSRNSWNRTTIPDRFGPCDQIEVFVGGVRLRKDPVAVYNENLGASSPLADTILEAEFSVDGISPYIRLTSPPPAGIHVVIVRRTGKVWYDVASNANTVVPFEANDNPIINFILQKTTSMP